MIINGDRTQVEPVAMSWGRPIPARFRDACPDFFFFRTGDGRPGLGEADGVFSHKPKPAANMIGVEIGQDIARLSRPERYVCVCAKNRIIRWLLSIRAQRAVIDIFSVDQSQEAVGGRSSIFLCSSQGDSLDPVARARQ